MPFPVPEIPSEESVIALGNALLDSTSSWKKGKSFQKKTVQTCSRPKGPQDGAPWHCRRSEHTAADATYDEFWSKLGVNKAENEKECVVRSPRCATRDNERRLHAGISPISRRSPS